jgi:hypothetical protein
MSAWWDDVAAELQARSEHAPDPWADFVEGATDEHLTDEQRAFLRQLDDQPALGRLTDD